MKSYEDLAKSLEESVGLEPLYSKFLLSETLDLVGGKGPQYILLNSPQIFTNLDVAEFIKFINDPLVDLNTQKILVKNFFELYKKLKQTNPVEFAKFNNQLARSVFILETSSSLTEEERQAFSNKPCGEFFSCFLDVRENQNPQIEKKYFVFLDKFGHIHGNDKDK